MNLQDAIGVIESAPGFIDETTPVGEAWAVVLASINLTPVPVSERLPGLEDCDAEGRCWWGEPQIGDSHDATWSLCTQDDAEEFLTWRTKCGWLPANALPTPGPGEI